jgi:hypothetical protein
MQEDIAANRARLSGEVIDHDHVAFVPNRVEDGLCFVSPAASVDGTDHPGVLLCSGFDRSGVPCAAFSKL